MKRSELARLDDDLAADAVAHLDSVKRSLFATSGVRERRYGPDVPSPCSSSRP